MKIAILSDIHGNYDALKEVLKRAKEEGVHQLLILGDIVGYYYHPDKILAALSEWNFEIIKGNHEKILDNLIADNSIKESIRLKYGSGHQEAIKKLTKSQLFFLKNLPDTKSVIFDKISVLMCHGSPWSNDYYIYPNSDLETINKCNSLEHDFVLIGHSHYPFVFRNSDSILLNPGSVGQSRQNGGRASWCIINTCNSCIQFFNTKYSFEKLLIEISKKDNDIKYLKDVLIRNNT